MPIVLILLLSSVVGLLFGSFGNVLVLRDNRRLTILTGRSECPSCKKILGGLELIPVFSWLALRGRCKKCHTPISFQYPLVELSAALLFAVAVWVGYLTGGSLLAAIFLALSLLLALVVSVIDIRTMEVPIDYVVAGGVCAFIGAYTLHSVSLVQALQGVLIGAGSLGAVTVLWKLIRREEGMGSGDIWIVGAIGVGLGPVLTVVALVLAVWAGSIAGIAYALISGKGLKIRMPFGPFLYGGGLAALVFGQRIADWYILNLR